MNSGNGNGNGQHNSSSSPSTIDIEHLGDRSDLPRAEPQSTGTLVAPGPGVSGPAPSLATFTTADAAGMTTFTNPIAAPPVSTTNAEDEAESSQSATDEAVDVLAASEHQCGFEEFVREMNIRGPQPLPPGAAPVPVVASPPFGVGVFAPVVTASVAAAATSPPAVNDGSAATIAAPAIPGPGSAPAPVQGTAGPSTVPSPPAPGRRRSHAEAFRPDGQPYIRPDGTWEVEHRIPSPFPSSASPSPAPAASAGPAPPAVAHSPPGPGPSAPTAVAARFPEIGASPPRPPAISITPPAPAPAASTGNTPEPTDDFLAEFFDVEGASE